MSKLTIRNYRPEDYSDVIKLYDATDAGGPFLARDGQYFNYFLSYPGVRQDSTFVAVSEDGVEGVAIIAINQDRRYTTGKIIELWASEAAIGNALVQKAVEYCDDQSADKLEVCPPAFLDTGNTFAGWQKTSQREVLMAKLLSPKLLLEAIFDDTTMSRIGSGKEFVFVCENEIIKPETSKIKAETKGGESQPNRSNITVSASPQTWLEIIFNSTSPGTALLTRRIKIRPLKSLCRALKMLLATRISRDWSLAIVDRR